MTHIGIMQGRLVPPTNNRFQCFPRERWADEFVLASQAGHAPVAWFGGGMDLTPYYGFEQDAGHFHLTCRNTLAPFGPGACSMRAIRSSTCR